jgi:hypothetical protein
MDMSIAGAFESPRSAARLRLALPVPRTAVRVLMVLALYGVAFLAIRGVVPVASNQTATSAATGMCHRR